LKAPDIDIMRNGGVATLLVKKGDFKNDPMVMIEAAIPNVLARSHNFSYVRQRPFGRLTNGPEKIIDARREMNVVDNLEEGDASGKCTRCQHQS
jgi:hypothetical protein